VHVNACTKYYIDIIFLLRASNKRVKIMNKSTKNAVSVHFDIGSWHFNNMFPFFIREKERYRRKIMEGVGQRSREEGRETMDEGGGEEIRNSKLEIRNKFEFSKLGLFGFVFS